MLKKNLALSVVYALTLAGLTACGGDSDSATETPVATPNPPPIPPSPITPPAPVEGVAAVGFASAVYTAEVHGVTDLVILGDSLYLSSVDDNSWQVWARFDNVIDAISENEIADAAGFSISGSTAPESATLKANLTTNEAGLITRLGSAEIGDKFYGSNFLASSVAMVTNLHQLNADWIEPDFPVFIISSALTLTAQDKNNCDISGILTPEDQVFAVALHYANCAQAGSYEGALWAYQYDEVTYLSWIAFDNDNKVVSGKLDTFMSQQEHLVFNGELSTQLYVNNSELSDDDILIVRGNKLHYLKGTKGLKAGDFFFEYTPPVANANAVVAKGYGNTWMNKPVVAEMTMSAATRKYSPFKGKITDKSVGGKSTLFSVAIAERPVANITGKWSDLLIADNGSVSGSITYKAATCTVVGTASDFTASTAELEVTLSGCEYPYTYTGAIAGFEKEGKETLALLAFDYDEVAETMSTLELLIAR